MDSTNNYRKIIHAVHTLEHTTKKVTRRTVAVQEIYAGVSEIADWLDLIKKMNPALDGIVHEMRQFAQSDPQALLTTEGRSALKKLLKRASKEGDRISVLDI